MRLDTWLDEALAPFPLNVQQRLAAEYREHYQDSIEAGEPADVHQVLGDPDRVRRALLDVYLAESDLRLLTWKPAVACAWVMLAAGFVIGPLSLYVAWRDGGVRWSTTLITCALTLGMIVWSVAWSRRWVPLRRRAFRSAAVGLAVWVVTAVNSVPTSPGRVDFLQAAEVFIFLLLAARQLKLMTVRDRRLQHTLALEARQP